MQARRITLSLCALALSAVALGACAADLPLRLLGQSVAPAAASRTIVVHADTSYIRVTGGETVEFVVGTTRFAWTFDGPEGPFDLAEICPPGLLKHKIRAFVEPNPLYTGS